MVDNRNRLHIWTIEIATGTKTTVSKNNNNTATIIFNEQDWFIVTIISHKSSFVENNGHSLPPRGQFFCTAPLVRTLLVSISMTCCRIWRSNRICAIWKQLTKVGIGLNITYSICFRLILHIYIYVCMHWCMWNLNSCIQSAFSVMSSSLSASCRAGFLVVSSEHGDPDMSWGFQNEFPLKPDYSVSLYTFLILYTILVMLLLMMMSSKLMSGFSSWHRCGSKFWADAWGKHQRNITISSVRTNTYPISSSNFFAISKKTPLKQLYCFRAWTIAPFITK